MIWKWIGVLLLCTTLGLVVGGGVGVLLVSYGRDYLLTWYIGKDWGDSIAPMDMALGKCSTSGAVIGAVGGMIVVIADAIYKSRILPECK